MNQVVNFIESHFSPMEQKALMAGLNKSDYQALKNGDVSSMSSPLKKVLYDKTISIKAPLTNSQKIGQSYPMLGHAGADLAGAGIDISNLARGIARIPFEISGSSAPQALQNDNTNPYDEYGIKENIADDVARPVLGAVVGGEGGESLAKSILDYLPNVGEKSSKVALSLANAAGGGAATSPEDPISGALGAVDTGGIIGSTGKALGAGADTLKEYLANFGQNEVSRKAIDSLSNRLSDNDTISSVLQKKYSDLNNAASNSYDQANEAAKVLDDNGIKIDSSPYKNTLKDYIDSVNQLTPIQKSAKLKAQAFAQEQLDSNKIPTSYQDLVENHKNLNAEASDFFKSRYPQLDAPDSETNSLISRLKQVMQDNYAPSDNGNVPNEAQWGQALARNFANDLKDSFNDANKAYSQKMDLTKTPDKYGNMVKNKTLAQGLKEGINNDTTSNKNLMNDFLKKPNSYQNLSNALGEDSVGSALASHVLSSADENGINIKDLVKNYNQIPSSARKIVFTPDEQAQMDALSQASTKSKRIGYIPYSRAHIISYALPAIAAGLGGVHGSGEGKALPEAAKWGASALLAEKAFPYLLSNPKMLRMLSSGGMDDTLQNLLIRSGGKIGVAGKNILEGGNNG